MSAAIDHSTHTPADLKFSGDENITRIIDQLIQGQKSIYGGDVAFCTLSGTFRGRIVSKGAQFVVIERDTRMHTLGSDRQQKIMVHQLIAMNSITSVSFEFLD